MLKRQPFEKHRKVVLNSGAGESTDEVKQQRVCSTLRVEDEERLLCRSTAVRQTSEPAVPPWRAYVGGNPGLIALAWIMDPGGGSEAQLGQRIR